MNKKITALAVSVVVIAVIAVAVALPAITTPPLKEVSLKMGLSFTGPTYMAAHQGVREGLFKERGLNIELVNFQGGSDAVKALSDDVPIVQASVTSALQGRSAGLPIKIVASVFKGNYYLVLVAKNSPVKSAADLKGATWAITRPGSATHANVLVIAKAFNWGPNDYKLLAVGTAEAASVVAGKTQATTLSPGSSATFLTSGDVVSIGRVNDFLGGITWTDDVLIATEKAINEKPEVIQRVVNAYFESWRKLLADHDGTVKKLIDYYGIKKEFTEIVWDKHLSLASKDGSIDPAAYANVAQVNSEAGLLTKPPPLSEVYITRFVPAKGS